MLRVLLLNNSPFLFHSRSRARLLNCIVRAAVLSCLYNSPRPSGWEQVESEWVDRDDITFNSFFLARALIMECDFFSLSPPVHAWIDSCMSLLLFAFGGWRCFLLSVCLADWWHKECCPLIEFYHCWWDAELLLSVAHVGLWNMKLCSNRTRACADITNYTERVSVLCIYYR